MSPAETRALPVGEFDLLCKWVDGYQRKIKEADGG